VVGLAGLSLGGLALRRSSGPAAPSDAAGQSQDPVPAGR
jgi:hypothetical protein